LTQHVVVVMSLLAWEGHAREADAGHAFDTGMRRYLQGTNLHALLPRSECSLERFDQRLRLLAGVSMPEKRRLLVACAACIMADRKATVREIELYRALGDVLGCPVPPLGREN
jgi:hypothetical protein